ncbi:hypothetical protein [Streptomyces phaeochromogenes]|uniref:hypothetical protein n=1 Tax=Streptomyces phaeochromogenes TaxID=1923 RepID=UPI003714A92B
MPFQPECGASRATLVNHAKGGNVYQQHVQKQGANHVLHVILTLLTCGLWAITGWPIAAAMGRKKVTTLYAPPPLLPQQQYGYPPQQPPYPPQQHSQQPPQYGPPPGSTPPYGTQPPGQYPPQQ